jgi:hypothetical protein
MASEDSADSSDSREQGVELDQLQEELATHDYPTTGDELLAEYGDYEVEFSGGSETLREILGKRRSESDDDEDITYESPEEVHQSILNMVGSEAVGREHYSDRGGAQQTAPADETDRDEETF